MEVEEADPKKNYNVRSYLKSYSQLNRSIYWRNRKQTKQCLIWGKKTLKETILSFREKESNSIRRNWVWKLKFKANSYNIKKSDQEENSSRKKQKFCGNKDNCWQQQEGRNGCRYGIQWHYKTNWGCQWYWSICHAIQLSTFMWIRFCLKLKPATQFKQQQSNRDICAS